LESNAAGGVDGVEGAWPLGWIVRITERVTEDEFKR
jgi:hypothetical protein